MDAEKTEERMRPARKTHHVNAICCDSFWSQARGLMFFKPKTLLFSFTKPTRVRLHMWFVFFSIDVLLLDEEQTIVEIKEDFKPFVLFTSRQVAKYVLEVPHGFVSEKTARVGDRIVFE